MTKEGSVFFSKVTIVPMGFPDCPPLNLETVSCSTKKIFLHSSGFTREEKGCRGEQREGIESKKVCRRKGTE